MSSCTSVSTFPRRRSQVAARDGNGELLLNRRAATRPDESFKVIEDAREELVEVAFEATCGWGRRPPQRERLPEIP